MVNPVNAQPKVPKLDLSQIEKAKRLHTAVCAIRDDALAETQEALKKHSPRTMRQARDSLDLKEEKIRCHLVKVETYLKDFPTDPKELVEKEEEYRNACQRIGEMSELLRYHECMREIRLKVANLQYEVLQAYNNLKA